MTDDPGAGQPRRAESTSRLGRRGGRSVRQVRVQQPLDVGAPAGRSLAEVAERFAGDPERWLPAPARRRGLSRWQVTLTAGPASRTANVELGSVWRGEDGLWRSITWAPDSDPGEAVPLTAALPSFTGELGVETGGERATLSLAGSYRPPGGALGAVADAAVGRRVAVATATDLLRRIADRLTAP